jgi:riboflavin kinase/FMN adenylyltransferase
VIIERSARPEFPQDETRICAIGTFDGVHLGHRKILDILLSEANRFSAKSVVVTFEPHPLEVLAPLAAPSRLTSLEEKARLLAEVGVDVLWAVPFTLNVAMLDPETFVKLFLVDSLGVKGVIVGFDFTFGHRGRGTADDLKRLGRKYGFDTKVVPAVSYSGMVVSSSLIRRLLKEGQDETARVLLGRPPDIPVTGGFCNAGNEAGSVIRKFTPNL